MKRVDRALLIALRTHGHTPAADRGVAAFSKTGEHAAIWLALGGLGMAADRPRRRAWARAAGLVGAAYLLNTAIKLGLRRPRPVLGDLPPLIGTPTGLSFPSAHATSSFTAARAYGRLQPAQRPALYGLASALAVSRVYLGVHYPSDVAAGAVLGTILGGFGR